MFGAVHNVFTCTRCKEVVLDIMIVFSCRYIENPLIVRPHIWVYLIYFDLLVKVKDQMNLTFLYESHPSPEEMIAYVNQGEGDE